jgi:hypothetical protein
MKKVKKFMFGGAAKALSNVVKSATAKAPVAGQKPLPSGMTFGLGSAAQANPRIPAMVGKMLGASKAPVGIGAAASKGFMPTQSVMQGINKNMMGMMGVGKRMKKGGEVKPSSKASSASKRGDGCAIKGKTKGKMV